MKAKTIAELAIAFLSIEAPFFIPLEIEGHDFPGSGGRENKLPVRRGSRGSKGSLAVALAFGLANDSGP